MNFVSKSFDELKNAELYEILRARFEVFVIEQECLYLDPDGIDYESRHIFIEENSKVLAYMRAFKKDESVIRIGRVLTVERKKGLGAKLLEFGIGDIKERFNPEKIFIESQTRAVGFYERFGFEAFGGEFMDAGIPHIAMELKLK